MKKMSLKAKVDGLDKQLVLAKMRVNRIVLAINVCRKKCKHEDLSIDKYGNADCNICGKHFHWYCPTSPTLTCDYNQDDGDYDEDHCIYCGDPEERK